MRLLSASPLITVPLILAQSVHQQPIQFYLHPTPALAHADSPPTLSADQAKAVLAHHLGEGIDGYEEIPADEALWGHLMGMSGAQREGGKARVVVIEGGVSPQGKSAAF